MKFFLYLILFLTTLPSLGQYKQVCFTIDDLPEVTYGITDTVFQNELMNKLIATLKTNKIPAIGFVNENKLYNNNAVLPFQVKLLQRWLDNGLELGNHTYSHPDYNSVSFDSYTRDIVKGELITRELLTKKGRKLQYFRHPFLHEGSTKSKYDSLNRFLADHGYKVAPVTIDNEDYLFALAYKRAKDKGDVALVKQIGIDYVADMERRLIYFELQAYELFGREIPQVLLLHASSLNADYMENLVFMFRRNGYEFIALDTALKDDVYKVPVTVYGKWGISYIDRWALSQGKKGDFFKDEPVTPEYIKKLAESKP